MKRKALSPHETLTLSHAHLAIDFSPLALVASGSFNNWYYKLILHALKHNTSTVNGVLLGCVSGGDSSAVVEVIDSVPLFHSQIGMLPPLEIALIQIGDYYGAQGLNIVDYYHANERFNDFKLGNVAKNVGDYIYRYIPQAAVLLLDNKKLEALPKSKERSPMVQVEYLM